MIRSLLARCVSKLTPGPLDVLVLRVPGGEGRVKTVRDELRGAGLWPKLPSGAIVLVLPVDVRVAVEPRLKPAEDLGYGETKNRVVDADVAAESKRAICGATPSR